MPKPHMFTRIDINHTENTNHKFYCRVCNFTTHKRYNYDRHCKTNKHIKRVQEDEEIALLGENNCVENKTKERTEPYQCIENGYTASTEANSSIVSREEVNEKNELKEQNNILKSQLTEMKSLVYRMLNSNREIQERISIMAKEPKVLHYQDNRQFNVVNYLNTECRDALNLSDFIDQMEYSITDLLRIPNEGWVVNVQNTFIEQLKAMDHKKRPIHCSDKKRRQFYVKEENIWNKDTDNQYIENALTKVQTRQCKTYLEWRNDYRDQIEHSDQKHDLAMQINVEVCKPSCAGGDKLKHKVLQSMTDLHIRNE